MIARGYKNQVFNVVGFVNKLLPEWEGLGVELQLLLKRLTYLVDAQLKERKLE